MLKLRTLTSASGIIFAALFTAVSASAGQGDATNGKEVFAKICASCHGVAGKGDGVAAANLKPKPRDLTHSGYMSALKDNYLRDIITKGGKAMGKSPLMPPMGSALKPEDVDNVIAFIRTLSR